MNDVVNSNFSHLTLVDEYLGSTGLRAEETRKRIKFSIERLVINSVRKRGFRGTRFHSHLSIRDTLCVSGGSGLHGKHLESFFMWPKYKLSCKLEKKVVPSLTNSKSINDVCEELVQRIRHCRL